MPLQKQPVQVVFGPVDQKTQSKLLRAGRPSEALDVVQKKTGAYSKRGGFGDTDRTTDTGTITVGADLAVANGAPVQRTADTVYARPGSTWIKRGSMRAVAPNYTPVAPDINSRSMLVEVGTQAWYFAQSIDNTYYWSVWDNGIQVQPPTQVNAGSALFARAVTTPGKVWLFAGPTVPHGTNNTIKLYMWSTTTPAAAPTVTTFASPTGLAVDGWDVLDAQANGNGIVVAVGSSDAGGIDFGGGAAALFIGRLNTANGLVDGTGWVAATGVALGVFGPPVSWVRAGQSATLLHLLWRRPSNSHIFLTTVTASTLASTSADTTAQLASQQGGLAGYRETATGNIVFFISNNTPAVPGVENSTITRASWDGAVLTGPLSFHRAMSIVSDPFFIGATPYIVCNHDDTTFGQNAYYVIDASASPGRIVARTLYQLGGTIWQRNYRIVANDKWDNNFLAPVTVSGTNARLSIGMAVGPYELYLARVSFEFAPTDLAQPTVALDGHEVLFPGGWSFALSGGGALAEAMPMMFPRGSWSVVGAGAAGVGAAGVYGATVRYLIVDKQGNISRSAPSPTQTVIITAGQSIQFSNVPTLRMINDTSTQVLIEYYITAHDDTILFAVSRQDNQPSIDVATNLLIGFEPGAGSEIIDTDGGALEPVAAPPFKWSAAWRGRIMLGGTDAPQAVVWPSFELAPGIAPRWNETLQFRLPDGAGKDVAGCAVDYNYFAIFKADSVWMIGGAGPDPLGIGSYGTTLEQVVDAPGCSNPRSVVQTPVGVLYQATNGEIWLIQKGGAGARYIGEGWQSEVATATVVGAAWAAQVQCALLFLSSSRVLVLDLDNPLPEQSAPYQQYVWRLAATPVAATVGGATLYWLDSTGVMHTYLPATYHDGTSTPILRRVKFPVNLAGVRGFVRIYRFQVVGTFVDSHSVKFTWAKFDGAAGETGAPAAQTWTVAVAGGPELFERRPNAGQIAVAELTLEDVSTDLHEGASWDGLALEVGVKAGLPRVNPANKGP